MKAYPKRILAVALLLPAFAFAQGPGDRGDRRDGSPRGPAAERGNQLLAMLDDPAQVEAMGITPEQAEKVREVIDAQRDARKDLQVQHRNAQRDLQQVIRSDDATEDQVIAAVEKSGQYALEIRKLETLQRFRIRQIVGEDVLRNVAAERRERWSEGEDRPARDRPGRSDRPGQPEGRGPR